MSTALWVAMEAGKNTRELNKKIQSLELLLANKAHCRDCKFFDTIYCGGLLDRDTLETPSKETPVYCSNFFLDEKSTYFNKSTIEEVKELEKVKED